MLLFFRMTYQRTFLPVDGDSDFISKRVPGIKSCTNVLEPTRLSRLEFDGVKGVTLFVTPIFGKLSLDNQYDNLARPQYV